MRFNKAGTSVHGLFRFLFRSAGPSEVSAVVHFLKMDKKLSSLSYASGREQESLFELY